jgi:hypothetical protein
MLLRFQPWSMSLKKRLAHFDFDMIPLLEFTRYLYDHVIPGDREAL